MNELAEQESGTGEIEIQKIFPVNSGEKWQILDNRLNKKPPDIV